MALARYKLDVCVFSLFQFFPLHSSVYKVLSTIFTPKIRSINLMFRCVCSPNKRRNVKFKERVFGVSVSFVLCVRNIRTHILWLLLAYKRKK